MDPQPETALRSKESETTEKGYERARLILDATRAIFAEEGYAGFSMRGVAAKVGVNLSTVQHYYPNKETLIEALLLQALHKYQAAVDRRAAAGAGATRLEQFETLVDYFLDDISTTETNGILCELFALANRHAFAAKILDMMLTRSRRAFRKLIAELTPKMSPSQRELRAALMVAQLQGVMLYLAASRSRHAELAGLKDAARAAIVRLATAR